MAIWPANGTRSLLFGKLFDPLADKLIVLTVLYCLADTDYAPWWVFFLMLGKEILMVLGSLLMLGKKVVVKSNIYGKTATCLFIAAIALAFPGTTSRRFSRLAMCCFTSRWRLRWFLWAYTPIRPLNSAKRLTEGLSAAIIKSHIRLRGRGVRAIRPAERAVHRLKGRLGWDARKVAPEGAR